MTRKIKIGEIGDFMDEQVQELVKATTFEWTKRVKEQTPVDTGTLKRAWQSKVEPYEGVVSNNVEYAEPVCFGNNLPPSWKGQFRTRQGTVAGFPELIGKELESWTKEQYERIKRKS
tara:strand:- start:270 stop:620 length:351 start_codon:yes stop_codon:yes gene_type:complete